MNWAKRLWLWWHPPTARQTKDHIESANLRLFIEEVQSSVEHKLTLVDRELQMRREFRDAPH